MGCLGLVLSVVSQVETHVASTVVFGWSEGAMDREGLWSKASIDCPEEGSMRVVPPSKA